MNFSILPPDRIYISGPYTVTLERGIFRDRLTVRKDVWPALGGLIGANRFKREVAEAKFDEIVRELSELSAK